MKERKILVIDDESGIRSSLKGIFEDEGYGVKTTSNGEKGLEFIKNEFYDLIFLDIWLPEMNGIEVLKQIKEIEENTQVVMITGHGSVEAAVKSTKLGAYDFLEKPLSLEKVVLTAKNALKQKKLEEENIRLRQEMKSKFNLIGKTTAIQKIREKIQTAAPTTGRILICGEHGTGKKLIARYIHENSKRSRHPFVQINVAAIPEDMIESELFGYKKENLSEKEKKGKLLLANKGTFFLDEIGE
ncbi:MAG: response regulator, partial [Candidatus Aminicenantes bacterium]|nr:response regulator [Candidatus Aminicenantes bacterium]